MMILKPSNDGGEESSPSASASRSSAWRSHRSREIRGWSQATPLPHVARLHRGRDQPARHGPADDGPGRAARLGAEPSARHVIIVVQVPARPSACWSTPSPTSSTIRPRSTSSRRRTSNLEMSSDMFMPASSSMDRPHDLLIGLERDPARNRRCRQHDPRSAQSRPPRSDAAARIRPDRRRVRRPSRHMHARRRGHRSDGSQGDAGLFAAGQAACAVFGCRHFATMSLGRVGRRRRGAPGDDRRAHHQRHALLSASRIISSISQKRSCLAVAERLTRGGSGAHVVGRLLRRPGALHHRMHGAAELPGGRALQTSRSSPAISTTTRSQKAKEGRYNAEMVSKMRFRRARQVFPALRRHGGSRPAVARPDLPSGP